MSGSAVHGGCSRGRHRKKERKDDMLHMIGHAIFGLVIGLLARAVMPGRQHMGLILTMILGLVGAWLGGLIGRMTGMYEEGHPAGFLMALVGAVVVLFVYSLVVA
jgi:uncharacterized membrane protein YeaQ/YmgE (transglycosylase-associated protein family)